MPRAPPPPPASQLTFYSNGDLEGPSDHLNYWNGAQWADAYRCVGASEDIKEKLEGMLTELRGLVQGYSDLLYHPGRTSDSPAEQQEYWNLYSNWYMEARQNVTRSLAPRLTKLWTSKIGKAFINNYQNPSVDQLPRESVEYITHKLIMKQYDSIVMYRDNLADHATGIIIRRTLNPTASGATVFRLDKHLKYPFTARNP